MPEHALRRREVCAAHPFAQRGGDAPIADHCAQAEANGAEHAHPPRRVFDCGAHGIAKPRRFRPLVLRGGGVPTYEFELGRRNASTSIRSVLARRLRRFTAIDAASTTWLSTVRFQQSVNPEAV